MAVDVKYYKELEKLRIEHESLEGEISGMMRCKVIDQFRLLDLKKKKLRIKESISALQDILYHNLSA